MLIRGPHPALVRFGAAALGATLAIAAFYPGYMSSDSIDQLRQARSGDFIMWHPPIMAWLWSGLDQLVRGPAGMLFLQVGALWAGIALTTAATLPPWPAAAATLVVGFWPPIFANSGTIWKDVQLGAALALATGLMLVAERRKRLLPLLPAAVLLYYGSAVRSNGVTAVLPLVVWWGHVLRQRLPGTVRASTGWLAAGSLAAAIVVTTGIVDARLTARHPGFPLQAPMVHDLVGLSATTGQDLLPAWLHEGPRGAPTEQLVRLYDPECSDPLYYGPAFLPLTRDRVAIAELRHQWVGAVLHHPGTYLRHRLAMFRTLLGIGNPQVAYPYHWDIETNDLGVALHRSRLNLAVMSALTHVRDSLLFRAWAYVAAALVACAVALATRRAGAATVALAASSALYVFPYLFVSPTTNFRYVWWSVIAALLMPFTIRTSWIASGDVGRAPGPSAPGA